jgi:hypothetical protein
MFGVLASGMSVPTQQHHPDKSDICPIPTLLVLFPSISQMLLELKIVKSWPVPTNVKELRSFMGFCGYYRKFIQNFSKLAKCLDKLTEKGRKFEWTNKCQTAFEELKNRLVS